MASIDNFRANGWYCQKIRYISSEGFNKLVENGGLRDPKIIMRKALDIDLKEIGDPIINLELSKESFGPVVLQITKIKNISAPKVKPNSQTAPRMLKLSLTDGQNTCQAIEIKPINSLNLENTPPGTKIFVNGAQISSGVLLIDSKSCVVLGGNVPALVERWEISKMMPSHNRVSDEGPPPWVNFGKKIITQNLQNQNFKSLKNKIKETEKDSDFQNQRQDLISEAAQGAIKKVFGGGTKVPQTFNEQSNSFNYKNTQNNGFNNTNNINNGNNNSNGRLMKKGKGREKVETEKLEKPSQRVSLFDFLEDKLPVTETPKPTEKSKDFLPRPKPKPFDKPSYENRGYDHQKTDYPPRNAQKYPRYNNNETKYEKPDRYQPERKPQSDFQNPRQFSQEKPPRFQRNQNVPSKSGSSYENKKPDTNNFVNKLTNEMNNICLYNSKFENDKTNQTQQQQQQQYQQKNESYGNKGGYRWKVGERCMAKYWEDNKYYNAVVTGITSKTLMVEFIEYGNFEEVLHCDCIPITNESETTNKNQYPRTFNENQQFSGNLEFRRKNRPFIKNQNRSFQ